MSVFSLKFPPLDLSSGHVLRSDLIRPDSNTMSTFRAHQKQFVLGPKPVSVWPDWITTAVADNLVLSVCPKLAVSRLLSRDGMTFYLLGCAVLADQQASISETFHLRDSSEIEEWSGFWAGKWALISEKCVWPDAIGALGLYYRNVGGEMWIASSPALLSDRLPDTPSEPYIAWQIKHRTGIDWIPLPFTTRENIYKVMPLRTINPLTGAIVPVRFGASNVDEQSLASAFKTIMINWAKGDFKDRYVSLTSGMDTRLVLAASSAAGLKVEARTMKYPAASKSDLSMPPRLAAKVGIPHKLMGLPNPALPLSEIMARTAAIVEHMDGATFHPATADFAHGLDDFMHDSRRTMATGHILDLGRCYYWRRFDRADLGDALPSTDKVLDAFFTRTADPLPFWNCHPKARWREAMQIWLNSLSEPRALKLDWRDAFHLDQGCGGWESNLYRLMDIQNGSYFPSANCLWVLYLLLRDPVEKKMEAFAQRQAISLLSPAMAKFPTNPPTRVMRVKRAVKNMLGVSGLIS